jgi:hypothetical protein
MRSLHMCEKEQAVGERQRYRIIVSGQLSEAQREKFADLHIEPNGTDTTLMAELDQPGLVRMIQRLTMSSLTLLHLTR